PPFSLPGHRVVPREPRFSLCDSFDVEKSCDGAASQGRYEPSTRRAPAPPQGHIGVEHGHFLASVVHVHALWPGADTQDSAIQPSLVSQPRWAGHRIGDVVKPVVVFHSIRLEVCLYTVRSVVQVSCSTIGKIRSGQQRPDLPQPQLDTMPILREDNL